METLSYADQLPQRSPSDIVLSVMDRTKRMEIDLYRAENQGTSSEPDLLFEASNTKCFTGSNLCIIGLYLEAGNFFDQYFVVRSFESHQGWNFHTYFVVRDIQGIYHAGSAAYPFLHPIESHNIHTLMEDITDEAPGVWPSPSYIAAATNYNPTPQQIHAATLRVLEFRYKEGQTSQIQNIIEIPKVCLPHLPFQDSFFYENTIGD